jgi:molybdopterin-synthase adenylyltransferase
MHRGGGTDPCAGWVVLLDTVEVVNAADGVIYLLHGAGEDGFAVDAPDDAVRHLVAALRRPCHVPSLLTRIASADPGVAATCRSLIVALCEHRLAVVVDRDSARLPARDRDRYDRQLSYLRTIAPVGCSAETLQGGLADAHVVVLGLGGVGSWVVFALASLGIGHIRGVDKDVVELSNLNRQILYRADDVGRPKALAAQRTVQEFCPSLAFEPLHTTLGSVADVADVVADADVVVAAVDEPVHDITRWINQACFTHGTAFIGVSQVPPLVRVGPLYVPGETPCYRCEEQAIREQYALYDEIVAHRTQHPAPAYTALGPACGVVGAVVGNEVLHHLTGAVRPATVGRAWLLDMQTMRSDLRAVRCERRCDLCAVDGGPRGGG